MQQAREAAGFVLACVTDGEPRYLLLRSASHQTWGAPKGHLEPGETPLQAATRETLEETGIDDLHVVAGFHREFSYEVTGRSRGSYLKRVHYFLARATAPTHVQSDEHDQSGWFTLAEVGELLEYPQIRQVFEEADTLLRTRR